MNSATMEYILPSKLKISTYTMVCNISHPVNLDLLSRLIPIVEPDHPATKTEDGAFISISIYSAGGHTDMPRGKMVNGKLPKRVFNNEITVLYKYHGFKQINLKIFTNGMLQMTGIIDPNWETPHLANKLIRTLKELVSTVHPTDYTPTTNHLDFMFYWTGTQVDYYRRNVESYDIDIVISKGIQYSYTNTEWKTGAETRAMLNHFIEKADTELAQLVPLQTELMNTYEYDMESRQRLYAQFAKYSKIVELEPKYLDYENPTFMNIITGIVANVISYYKIYKKRIAQLIATDESLVKDLTAPGQFPNALSSGTYALNTIAIELINSDYNTRFNNNLQRIHELLNTTKYGIYNSYKPSEKYAGVIAKFMYNANYLANPALYKPGKCYCAESCVAKKKKKPECVPISISIFRPGSIIITAAKDIRQLVYVYNYLNDFCRDNFAEISYVDELDSKDHFISNEERKIMRKENLVYVKRSAIRYD